MSYAYPRSTRASSLRSSYRDHFAEPPSLSERLSDALPAWISNAPAELRAGRIPLPLRLRRIRSRADLQATLWLVLKSIFTVANGLIVLWLFTLWWGERTVFQESIDRCVWDSWEKWVGCPCSLAYFWPVDVSSHKVRRRTMSPSLPTLNSWTPIHTPAGRGPSRR